jgi:hypothetical protein
VSPGLAAAWSDPEIRLFFQPETSRLSILKVVIMIPLVDYISSNAITLLYLVCNSVIQEITISTLLLLACSLEIYISIHLEERKRCA